MNIVMNKNNILIGIAVVAVLVTGVLVSVKYSKTSMPSLPLPSFLNLGMSRDAVTKKAMDYLNNTILQQGQKAELVETSEESGVIKIKIKIGTNTYDSYVSKDGKLLFPEAFNITNTTK